MCLMKELAEEKETPRGCFSYRGRPQGGEEREHRWDVREIVLRRDGESGTRSLQRGQAYGVWGDCALNDVVL